jgi:hypothetical protein
VFLLPDHLQGMILGQRKLIAQIFNLLSEFGNC